MDAEMKYSKEKTENEEKEIKKTNAVLTKKVITLEEYISKDEGESKGA